MAGRAVRMKLRRLSVGNQGRRLMGMARATGRSRRGASRCCLSSSTLSSTAVRYSVMDTPYPLAFSLMADTEQKPMVTLRV